MSLNAREIPVEAANLLMPAVRVPPRFKGTVEIWYWPRALTAGFIVAGTTLAAVLILTVRAIRQRSSEIRC